MYIVQNLRRVLSSAGPSNSAAIDELSILSSSLALGLMLAYGGKRELCGAPVFSCGTQNLSGKKSNLHL